MVNGEMRAVGRPPGGQPTGGQPSGGRLPWQWALRPAVAGLLLLAAIAGVSAASPAIGTGGRLRGHPLALAVALEIVLALLLLGVTVLARRSPLPGHLRTQLRYLVRWATIVLMIVVVVIGVVNYVGTRHGSSVLKLLHAFGRGGKRSAPRHHLPPPVHGPDLTYLVYALIAILLLAAIAACVLLVARLRPAQRSLFGQLELEDDDGDDGASLRRAVESGRAALNEVDEARAAIIACYLAMERSLATAGTARAAAETPDELLARATGTGLLRGRAATQLTALFYEARFSTHPLPDRAKASATAALNEISAALRNTAALTGGEALQ